MGTSFFGGDSSVEHYTARSIYRLEGENGKAAQQRRNEEYKKLKALGYKEKYFQFKTKDLEADARARQACEAFAAEWAQKSGVQLEVSRGFFL